ncbi:hypothetical protein ES677_15075 [Bizionia gelidisalsuginis]|uniref:Lipoprotein n=1 Tax=Bizionia gelidisalsuginis TaxID=291188 RepID=A0ABY3M6Q5_9FLAO|nr:hypothetical protein [Bizionia gelidisalsuginis]TYC07388.1 hypothetical protein ES677_15075 [Bizionia gelidisalsuginis]
MKKPIYISLIFIILTSCSANKTISEIKNYVKEIENRTDLNESITEFNTENLNGEIIGGTSTYELTDKKNKLYRIITETAQPNDSTAYFEFYYKQKKLIFAKALQFSNKETDLDTITNTELYFYKGKLIKQIDFKLNKGDSEKIKLLAESYTVEGLGT